jgi:hypothetical protein
MLDGCASLSKLNCDNLSSIKTSLIVIRGFNVGEQHQCPFVSREAWKKGSGSGSGHPAVHVLSVGQNPSLCPSNQTTGWLLGLGGAHAGEDLRVTVGETYVGSGWDSDIVLTTPEVSRRHGKFTSAGGVILLEDNGSATGIAVNGEFIREPRMIQHGDRIKFGVGDFLFYSADETTSDKALDDQNLKIFKKCASPTLAWLICRSGDCSGMDFRLLKGLNRVGALPGLEIVLPDQNLNSIHMTIECSDDRIYLRPGFATLRLLRAGSIVERPGSLRDRDVLRIGALELFLRCIH